MLLAGSPEGLRPGWGPAPLPSANQRPAKPSRGDRTAWRQGVCTAPGKHPHSTATPRPRPLGTAAPSHFWATSSRTRQPWALTWTAAWAFGPTASVTGLGGQRTALRRRPQDEPPPEGSPVPASPSRSPPGSCRLEGAQVVSGAGPPHAAPPPTIPASAPSAAAGLGWPSCLGTRWETPTHCALRGGQPSLRLPVPAKL